ncbi:MAG: response regulator [Mucilaginibacter sp.]|uniref:hybrid sensor histidine kinase/response regulator transcription factor n=1 Tax=Mucilaginibacter sp. TaxID=1882438 RepID=UPI0034E469C8
MYQNEGLSGSNFFKNFVFCVLFIFIVSGTVYGQSFPYKFNYLTVDEGLSHTDANDIAQDKQGFIWVATYFGLDRYDGYTIKQYYNNNAPLNNAFKNRIVCIYPDETGMVWLGTEDGLQCFNSRLEKYIDFKDLKKEENLRFDKLFKPAGNLLYGLTGGQVKLYLIKGNSIEEQRLKVPLGVQFSDMVADQKGVLYLSSNKGLWTIDQNRNFKPISLSNITGQNLSLVYFDHQNNLLTAAGNTLFLINKKQLPKISTKNPNLTVAKRFTCVGYPYIKDIAASNQSDYWINTGSDLLKLDSNLNFVQTVNNKSSQGSLNSNSLSKVFIDRSQCLWICTFGGGVNYCDLNQKLFYTLQHNPETSNSLAGNHIRSVLEDGENLWIGTTANGLNLYNLKTQKFTYFNTYNSPVKLKNDAITSLTFDNDHNLWIGSSAGIELLKPGRKELWKPPGYNLFPAYAIETLVKDCFGNIWFGNHTNKFGVIWKDKLNGYHVKYYGEGYFILADKTKPQLFISSTHGLKRAIIDAQGNISQTFYYRASSKPNSLSSDYTYPICKQDDSTYWVGTIGGGLNHLVLGSKDNSYRIKSYTSSYGVFNDVESMELDNAGNIWIGGNGLEYFDPRTEKLIKYDKNDGLQGNSFKVGASYKGADGRLYFGGINGLNYFYPNQIKANGIDARPVLTDILIDNLKPHYGQPDSTENFIDEALNYSKTLKLSYLQNNFVVFFSAMHFANPLKCRYRYKLIGFDKGWKYTDGKKPSAAYSNLDYNNYKFVVEATNNDGMWGKSTAETTIIITAPWWKSTLAKAVYLLLFFAGLLLIYLYQARWHRLKREIEVRGVEEEKREEMHRQREELYQQQLQFFTNISHEFRTPLTLILGPLESLINGNKNPVLDNSYQLMFRNVKRLINLINELMNFKKVADSAIKLQVQQLAISVFCKNIYLEFQNFALRKDIKLQFIDHTQTDSGQSMSNFFDAQILEKILFNLLNNALKYTNAGGQVTLELFFDPNYFKPSFSNEFHLPNEQFRADKYIYILVSDTGIGISKDSISSIFNRYYQIGKNHLGSGVGLALVKSLTQLHKGNISVYSDRNKGTELLVALPWGEENYTANETLTPESEPNASQLELSDIAIIPPAIYKAEDGQPVPEKTSKHILLVDDNQELRIFLRQSLEKFYCIDEAENGESALAIATNKIPDLIISDVMMPGMNGIELCRLLKEKFETSHIPFVILSAKDALDTKLEGMESGADYYFAKPLSIDLLLLTIHNILQQGEKLKLKYTKDYLADATELVHSEKDKEFMNKLLKNIEDNIQNPDLDVDFLCNQLNISRTKLYQKIKSISDQSIGDFIKTIRLKKAIQIMTHEDVAFNEVAFRIGLQSHAYFSRVFKKEFGKSPSEFMQTLKRNSTA